MQTALVVSMVLIIVVLAGTLTTIVSAFASVTPNLNNTGVAVPTAELVYQSESMKLPPSVGSFIILIAKHMKAGKTKNTNF